MVDHVAYTAGRINVDLEFLTFSKYKSRTHSAPRGLWVKIEDKIYGKLQIKDLGPKLQRKRQRKFPYGRHHLCVLFLDFVRIVLHTKTFK